MAEMWIRGEGVGVGVGRPEPQNAGKASKRASTVPSNSPLEILIGPQLTRFYWSLRLGNFGRQGENAAKILLTLCRHFVLSIFSNQVIMTPLLILC